MKGNRHELASLEKEIAEAERDLSKDVGPAYDKARATMNRMTDEREEARKRMEELYGKTRWEGEENQRQGPPE